LIASREGNEVYVCSCKAITDRQLVELGREGKTEVHEIVAALELDDPEACGRCLLRADVFASIVRAGGIARAIAPEQPALTR
jgi:bacterioferritin-associated ferredoxin